MKTLLIGAALLAAASPALAQTNVSISVGQPGFYGRIDIGDYGPPPVVYEQRPIIIREVQRVRAQPVYLRVPPGHRKNWSRHCGRYNACARPVYFVTDEWYANSYAPRYHDEHHHKHGKHKDKGHGRGHGKGHGHD